MDLFPFCRKRYDSGHTEIEIIQELCERQSMHCQWEPSILP